MKTTSLYLILHSRARFGNMPRNNSGAPGYGKRAPGKMKTMVSTIAGDRILTEKRETAEMLDAIVYKFV